MRPLWLMLALLLGCGGEADPERAPSPVPAHEGARERGLRMLERAEACEARLGSGDGDSCREACRLGHSNSCARAAAYQEADGGADGAARALALYLEACRGGSGTGCQGAARLLDAGRGAPADPDRSDRLMKQARLNHRTHCRKRYAPSCVALAELYREGLGGVRDRGLAAEYDRRACALGVETSCR